MTKLESKLILDGNGSYLGMEKGCFVLKDKKGRVDKFPLFEQEIGEVILKSGNSVSTGALASLGFWDIDVLIMTSRGRPVAMLKSLDDDSHVKTRLCQYEAVNNGKGIYIAKQIVMSKLLSQNIILNKYLLETHDLEFKDKIEKLESSDLETFRRKLNGIEGKYTQHYFNQIFDLIPENIRPETRESFKAYDGINNLFNLAYEMLSWKIHRAMIKAKLEPYLGFLHSVQFGKPSLVCDFQELYRYLIDDFLIQYCRGLTRRDFTTKSESVSRTRKGKREYLNDFQTRELMKLFSTFFESKVEISRIKIGMKQTIETLINEEALLFAKYLRNEMRIWYPRIMSLSST